MVVLHQSKFSILLLNEEDWCSYGGLGWSDVARIEVFFEKGIQLLLLCSGEWVDLAAFGVASGRSSTVWSQGLVPRSSSKESLEKTVEAVEVWQKMSLMICRL